MQQGENMVINDLLNNNNAINILSLTHYRITSFYYKLILSLSHCIINTFYHSNIVSLSH